jgi:hypothetical protein
MSAKSKPVLTLRFHLTDGSVHSFAQGDDTLVKKIWDCVEPARLFARPRIVVGSEHSKRRKFRSRPRRLGFGRGRSIRNHPQDFTEFLSSRIRPTELRSQTK